MTGDRRSILIDGRVNGLPGAHGLARSLVGLAENLGQADDGLTVRVLINPAREQLFPLTRLSKRTELVSTDITLGALHRFRALARLIGGCGAAVLYVPYPLFRPLLCPCPVVVTIHDCTIESDAGFAGGRHRQLAMLVATRAVLSRAAAVTTPTKSSFADLLRFYPSAPNPVVVPNGVDRRRFANVTARAVAEVIDHYRLPEQFILTVGAHRPHKNHGVLVRAMLAVPPQVSLVIVGYPDPNFREYLPSLITELGLESRVRLVPPVAEDWLPAFYRAASVFALPSLAEGYGLPALEAMAAGIPVVASAIPVLEEVCSGAALLVPGHDPAAWASALNQVLDGGPSVTGLVCRGAAVAAAATWERGGRSLSELLASVARSDRGPGPG